MSISDWTRSETISAPDRIWISWTTDPVGSIPAAEREQLLLSTTKSNTTSSYQTLGYRDASGVLRTQDVQVKNEDIRSTTKASVNQEWIAARLKYGRGLPGGNDFERSVREMFYVASTDGPAMVREVTTTYISYVALAGQLQGIPYWWTVQGTPPGTVYYDPPEGEIISQYTVVQYQQVKTAEGRDVTRTLTSRWVALGLTSEGKSAFGKEMQVLRRANLQTAAIINRRLSYYGELVFQGTEVQVSTGRVPVPIKPSDSDLANNEVVNGGGGGGGGNDDTGFENPEPEVNNDKTITGRVIFDGQNYDDDNPTVTATYDMPFAPDDYFYYDGGTRKLQRSDARRAAERFGQCEAALDIGHAFGQNIVTSFDLTPTLDLAPVYIRLAGIEGAFLLDAPSYAWGPEGMVVSSDLLLIGVTGYDGLSAPAASWLRLPVSPSSIGPAGVTTVENNPAKANTIAIPGGFDVRNLSPVFAALPTNGADVFREWRDNSVVLPPTLVLENDTIAAGPTVAIVEFSYELDAGTDTETLATGPAVEFAWLTQVTPPVAVVTVAALAPAVRTGVRVAVPAAAVSLAGVAPAVVGGVSVAVPAAAVTVAGITPDLVGRQRTQALIPVAGLSVTGLAPSVAGGASVAVPVAAVTVAGVVPSQVGREKDPHWANVSLLLHMDGSNGGTTFTDSSSNAHSITAFGNAQVGTTDPKYGTGALLLDGNGDYLQTPADADFAFGTGDFTVECWCYATVVSDNDGLFTFGGTSSGLHLALFQSRWTLGTAGGDGTGMGSATADLNTWRHVAVTRSGTSLRLFIDGVQKGSTLTNSKNLTDNQLKIGYYFGTIYGFVGKIDEFRVTKGVARYTSNFTPPTAPFPDA